MKYHIETVYYITASNGRRVAKCYDLPGAAQLVKNLNRAANDNYFEKQKGNL